MKAMLSSVSATPDLLPDSRCSSSARWQCTQRLLVPAKMGADPADHVLRVGDRGRVGERAPQPQRLDAVLEGLGVAVLLAEQQRQAVLGLPDAGPVTELDEQAERPPQVQAGRLGVAPAGRSTWPRS